MEKLTCKICGFTGTSLVTHLKHKHQISCAHYKEIYGDGPMALVTDERRREASIQHKERCKDPLVLAKMAAVQKNGASVFTTGYWIKRGLSEKDAIEKISAIQRTNGKRYGEKLSPSAKRENSNFCVEYWMKRGKSEQEASEIISARQAKLSGRSSKFAGKVRTEASKIKISNSMKRKIQSVGASAWGGHFGIFTNGRSNAEVDFYNYIRENIEPSVKASFPIGDFIVDVIVDNKVIEFYGDFWHANPRRYSPGNILTGFLSTGRLTDEIWERDGNRVAKLKSAGYDVLIIWEYDWNHDRSGCIDKIKNYLHGV